jgi:hypothetical protein
VQIAENRNPKTNLRLVRGGGGDEEVVQNVEDIIADAGELLLDLKTVPGRIQKPKGIRLAFQCIYINKETYSLMRRTLFSLPLLSSFCSMEETMRQEARRAPKIAR